MRAVWVDEDSDANYDKLRAHGITAPYYSHRDTRVTASYLESVKAKGFAPGIFSAWNWFEDLTGPQYAEHLSNELKRINWKGNAPVLVDIETKDVAYILSFFKRWRELRPTRKTDWTLEGFQGGLFTGNSVGQIIGANVGVCPQLYAGNMTPLEHSPIIDLLIQGFPGSRLFGVYDAARLPTRWRGYAFTSGRLP